MAALQMARARLEANQADLAIGLYEYVVDNGYPKAMQIVARERLARVLLDQGQPAEALTVLQGADDTTGFESRFAEVRGDIQFAQGRNDEAAEAYREALDALEAGAGDRARLVMKLESLGAEVPAEESQS
jgi:predicted negative regulator of RcsB-dependent stress response